ncbi:MAG: hypothetical protein WC732_05635 [Candidatus Omnitrophota bacterium]
MNIRLRNAFHIVSGICYEIFFGLVLIVWTGALCLAASFLYR